MNKRTNVKTVSRRAALRVAYLAPAGAVAVQWLAACGDKEPALDQPGNPAAPGAGSDSGAGPTVGADASTPVAQVDGSSRAANPGAPDSSAATGGSDASSVAPSDGAVSADATVSADAGASADAGVVVGDAGPNTPWATGGTKSMTGNYPDPFTMGAAGSACVLYPAQTLGPCYAQMPPTREDISDGVTGLPVRLALLVVGSDGCTPIPNASVDIWHSGFNGVYSAFQTGTICNPGSENVLSKRYCRGVQVTDANGRVNFSTIFPGWYTGRTIHIHFTVRLGSREAATSQLYFQDALSDEILTQGEYAARSGRRDTTNANDGTFRSGGATADQVVFSTAKRADGVLHAWKLLSVRRS
jgi:protocatechuate 3,4-dioxygenase beta subunit